MGSSVLRGISTALLVTVLTLFAGIIWGAVGLGGLSVSRLVDIGLLASCLVGGYRTGKESGQWLIGGVTGAGYVTLGTILLALFLPIQGWGFIQVLTEGAIIGLVAGAVGAGGKKGASLGAGTGRGSRTNVMPSYGNYNNDDYVSRKFDSSTSNWMEGPEEEYQGSSRAKWDLEEGTDVEWPWDREEDQKLICSESKHSEELVEWEPDEIYTGTAGNNGINLNNTSARKEGDSRPWWE
ncbi:MAG TPA: hypothetical protein VN456_01235 [Desulfosporosinus sp.]|nr:hypothetical protein [Desulfosporosinus sp.]